MRLRLLVLSVLSLLLAEPSQAYPIFFKCGKGGEFSEILTPRELQDLLRKMILTEKSQQKRDALLDSICDGKKECERQFNQVISLAEIERKTAESLFEQNLSHLKEEALAQPVQEVNSETYNWIKRSLDDAIWVNACRKTMTEISPADFVKGDSTLLIYYPYFSKYIYATGCRKSGPENQWACNLNRIDELEATIKGALAAGVDPYFALTIDLMEHGSGQWGTLHLDPLARLATLGCHKVSSGNKKPTQPGTVTFMDYTGWLEYKSEVIENQSLSDRIATHLKLAVPNPLRSGKSYFCHNLEHHVGSIHDSPQAGECCLQLSFKIDDPYGYKDGIPSVESVEKALTFEFVRGIQNRPLSSWETDHAYIAQRFNGFSKLMGGIEGVSAFRTGVNFYKTPSYGYQSLDFMLNSLMLNPYIQKVVQEASKKSHLPTKSLFCTHRAPGAYVIESEYYFKKHAESPRLEVLIGRKYSSYDKRETAVMNTELKDPTVMTKLRELGCDPTDCPMERKLDLYWKNIYESRRTVSKASNLEWGRLSDGQFSEIKALIYNQLTK